MILFLILAMVLLFSLQSLFSRLQATAYPGERNLAPIAFSVWYGILIALFTCIAGRFSFHPSPETVLLGVCNALVVLGYHICLIGASDRGAYSITMIFMIFGGILIPLAVSVVFLNEKLTLAQLTAIGGMLVSFFFLNRGEVPGKENQKRGFLALCVLLFLFNGLYGTIMDLQQRMTGNTQNSEMVVVTYFMLAVFSFLYLILKYKGRARKAVSTLRQTKRSLLFLILVGVVGTCAQNLVLFLLGRVQAAVLYTFDNGGTMLMSVLFSVLFFHERLGKVQIFAVLLALFSLVALSIL